MVNGAASVQPILDPFTRRPIEHAQAANCPYQHSYSLSSAMMLFGAMKENGECRRKRPCWVCKRLVTAYEPHPVLQEIADNALKISKGPSPTTEIKDF